MGKAAGRGSRRGARLLAGQFNLNLPSIARHRPAGRERGRGREHCRPALADLPAVHPPAPGPAGPALEPRAAWNDIVLPEAEEQMLRQIAGQVRQRAVVYDTWGFRNKMTRGLGISALFAGESGTGKPWRPK